MELNQFIEHTLLKQDAKKEEIIKLAEEAKEYGFKYIRHKINKSRYLLL